MQCRYCKMENFGAVQTCVLCGKSMTDPLSPQTTEKTASESDPAHHATDSQQNQAPSSINPVLLAALEQQAASFTKPRPMFGGRFARFVLMAGIFLIGVGVGFAGA